MAFTKLTDEQIQQELSTLHVAWSALPGEGLVRVIPTHTFKEGFALLATIADLAERQNHHPKVTLSYSQLELTLTTHSAGGVTQQDIELAQAIDQLLQ